MYEADDQVACFFTGSFSGQEGDNINDRGGNRLYGMPGVIGGGKKIFGDSRNGNIGVCIPPISVAGGLGVNINGKSGGLWDVSGVDGGDSGSGKVGVCVPPVPVARGLGLDINGNGNEN